MERRIIHEIQEIRRWPPEDFILEQLDPTNWWNWRIHIRGPKETQFEGSNITANIEFPPEYPFAPPIVRFTTEVTHPRIMSTGVLSLKDDDWRICYKFIDVLNYCCDLLKDPNIEDFYKYAEDCLEKRLPPWQRNRHLLR